jgi:hypothetical protein
LIAASTFSIKALNLGAGDPPGGLGGSRTSDFGPMRFTRIAGRPEFHAPAHHLVARIRRGLGPLEHDPRVHGHQPAPAHGAGRIDLESPAPVSGRDRAPDATARWRAPSRWRRLARGWRTRDTAQRGHARVMDGPKERESPEPGRRRMAGASIRQRDGQSPGEGCTYRPEVPAPRGTDGKCAPRWMIQASKHPPPLPDAPLPVNRSARMCGAGERRHISDFPRTVVMRPVCPHIGRDSCLSVSSVTSPR